MTLDCPFIGSAFAPLSLQPTAIGTRPLDHAGIGDEVHSCCTSLLEELSSHILSMLTHSLGLIIMESELDHDTLNPLYPSGCSGAGVISYGGRYVPVSWVRTRAAWVGSGVRSSVSVLVSVFAVSVLTLPPPLQLLIDASGSLKTTYYNNPRVRGSQKTGRHESHDFRVVEPVKCGQSIILWYLVLKAAEISVCIPLVSLTAVLETAETLATFALELTINDRYFLPQFDSFRPDTRGWAELPGPGGPRRIVTVGLVFTACWPVSAFHSLITLSTTMNVHAKAAPPILPPQFKFPSIPTASPIPVKDLAQLMALYGCSSRCDLTGIDTYVYLVIPGTVFSRILGNFKFVSPSSSFIWSCSETGVQHTLRPPSDLRYDPSHRRMGSDGRDHDIRAPGAGRELKVRYPDISLARVIPSSNTRVLRTFALLEIKISYLGDGRQEIQEGNPRILELYVQASGYFTKVNEQPNALHKEGGYVRVFVVFGQFYIGS
ncbi:hypothetical protein DFH08DRAFT_971901 [Mycena albidolilacea]|uniref:Uncharacterized protein n=1 Tax=Mycena albidolilacea TaxID=1033008 RepID=A0AAD6ZC49_9AGAR|nr:hypothetical protein DFH08DRAFT_971901 [Mycena albidolilacea]